MLLNSVILVLREVLEAAVLISVLLALGRHLRLASRWLLWALPLAALGALCFAAVLEQLTDAMDGAGQEVTNAALQFLIYLLLLLVVVFSAREGLPDPVSARTLRRIMALAVVCAMVREGSEIAIYVTGFAAAEDLRASVYAGSLMGAGLGISLGILLCAALCALAPAPGRRVCVVLLILIGAGMVMQATMLLEQVDWLPSGRALWDSSGLLREDSIAGELMYAVFGYEATPGSWQALLYGLGILLMLLAGAVSHRAQGGIDGDD